MPIGVLEFLDGGEYPRPQLVRRSWCSLDGEWDFADGGEPDQQPDEVEFDERIVVPFPPESPASGIGRTAFAPVVWYRRTISPDDIAAAGWSEERDRLLLHFGAVDQTADVWLAGRHVGGHDGGQSPFELDVTAELDGIREPVELVVRAVDHPDDAEQPRGKQAWQEDQHLVWYHRTTGIWQPVWLEAVPRHRIAGLHWNLALERATIEAEVEFSGPLPTGSQLSVLVTAPDGTILAHVRAAVGGPRARVPIALSALSNAQAAMQYLWSPGNPRLLEAQLRLGAGEHIDEVESYLGLRRVEARQTALVLNDAHLRLRGVLEQGYWPASHLAAPSGAALRDEVRLIKDLGFNLARIHQKAEDPRFLYWTDRLGLLVWGELGSAYGFGPTAVERTMREWTAIVQRDRSHPSIVAWVPLNESWGVQDIARSPAQQAFASSLASLTRALDPTRPVISNDGCEHVESDIWTVHDYADSPEVLTARYGDAAVVAAMLDGDGPLGRRMVLSGVEHRPRPAVLSEFGGISFDPDAADGSWGYSSAHSAEEFERRLRDLVRAADEAAGIAGWCYTQLTDTGLETNGLLTAGRTLKLPIEVIRAIVRGAPG